MDGSERADRVSIPPEAFDLREGDMVQEDRWKEIRRLHGEGATITEIGRRLGLDRKTVRRCVRQAAWTPYRRAPKAETLLSEHADHLRERAPQVRYSVQILFQELRRKGFRGSYETVKRFVRPLREALELAERAAVRFETPPGHQSQVDWGSARLFFREQAAVVHFFVLTLGFCRRSFYEPMLNERLPQFLDAHERAFDHFGGHTQEHLYDRPRTVCHGTTEGKVVWNPTFKSFADYWSFEPRLCRAYRAQTKGKVESGVRYLKSNFLPGRRFVDLLDLREQLVEWNATIADLRIHGTTHTRPIDRFHEEREHLLPVGRRRGFRLEARFVRIVADDFLVNLDTNRYSVPFGLIGQTVEVERRGGEIRILHRDRVVASHPELTGRHQLRILPEHSPGAIARAQRHRRSTPRFSPREARGTEVEVRDLAHYDALLATGGGA